MERKVTISCSPNAVVLLWNTVYMQAALDHLRNHSFEIRDEDETRLSPLVYRHINVIGRFLLP